MPNFVAFLVLSGKATSFIEKQFFFRNVNITRSHFVLLGGEQSRIFQDRGTNQITQKILPACEVYANQRYPGH